VERHPSLPAEIGGTLAGWVTGQLKVCAILAAIYAIGFAISGVPWWPLIAVLCAALNVVPIIGPVIALALAAGAGYFGTGDIYAPLGALITFVIAQALEGFYLTPKILGRRLRLHPLAVFLAVLAGGSLFGPLGIVFAAPVLAVILVLWRRLQRSP
jgi:predicted PurR-regulated permease PerM